MFNFFKKKTPLSSTSTNQTPLIQTAKTNNSVMYARKQSLANFVTVKQKKAEFAKQLRNHVNRLKSVSNAVRNESYALMSNNIRNRTRKLVNYKNFNSLSNDQVIELYKTGKVRSLSQ